MNIIKIYNYFNEKYNDNKKAFNSLLDLIAYRLKIDDVSSPAIHLTYFEDFITTTDNYITAKNINVLIDLLYELKLEKQNKPIINHNELTKLCDDTVSYSTILIQDKNIRCGENMIHLHNIMKDREYVYYGVSDHILEYKIALINAKMLSIPAFMLCANLDDTCYELNKKHWFLTNKWKKTSKKYIDTNFK